MSNSSDDQLGFDPDALREKYRMERDKRLRSDGNDQYIEVKGEFEHFVEDPYVESGFTREPIDDDVDVALVGGGFGGLLAGARLREAGVESLRIIEKGGDFGGTWYWNRYPGIACDVESYVYMPMLEELGYIPKEKYSRGDEIWAHSRKIAEKYDLYRDACFQTEVTGMRWDDEASRWIIETNRGDTMKARFVVMANGILQRPKLPGIPGINDFKGHTFHTSRWDYAYTGGDAHGNLTGLRDKRVGVIGTGATAVQCIPYLGVDAKELFVFQRTPSSIDVRNNAPTDPEWASSLEPGWQKRRMQNFHTLTAFGFEPEDLVNDGWTDIIRNLLSLMSEEANPDLSPEALSAKMELADFMKMEGIRARVESIVEDPATAEALKPYYRQFCKRPCFHDEYLQTFNRPNVTLVDTKGQGVERVTENGVVVDGREYELDCLIFATGFEVGTGFERRAGYDPVGRDGIALSKKWGDGTTTLHGMHVHGFPNCFLMGVTQSGFTVNFPHMSNEQANHISYIVRRAMDEGVASLEATSEAEAAWIERVLGSGAMATELGENCTPGYYNNEGRPERRTRQSGWFFGEAGEFEKILADWRADGEMKGLARR